ncbi:MAG: hypothetical protein PHH52_01960 [Patescibacteria group bacterium]|nr:hypothetical protein [Patescibacteria group bacterium]MDD3778126.1 hypothetical protein [Patescibacteria group bacterium]
MKKIIFVLFVILFTACGKKEVVVAEDCCEELRIEVARLQERVTFLEKLWEMGNVQAIEVVTPVEVETVVPKSAPAPRASAPKSTSPTTKKSTTPVSKPISTPPTPAPVAKTRTAPSSVTPGLVNLDYLRQGGEILYCIRANEREDMYFPHYAMNQGVRFNNPIIDNQIKGYNFLVEPTEGYQGDYGITNQGVFYVSNTLIMESLRSGGVPFDNVVEIKAPFTGWDLRKMTKSGDYWIYKTQ